MTIDSPYASVLQYRAAIDRTSGWTDDAAVDADILDSLLAASNELSRRLERFFTKDAADVTRLFPVLGNGPSLYVTDLSAAPTTVKTGGATTDFSTVTALVSGTDYELGPLNAPLGPEVEPYTHILLKRGYFTPGGRVQVVGKFGWPAVPPAIRKATIELAAILRLETPRVTGRIPEMDQAIDMSAEAKSIISTLSRHYSRTAAFV